MVTARACEGWGRGRGNSSGGSGKNQTEVVGSRLGLVLSGHFRVTRQVRQRKTSVCGTDGLVIALPDRAAGSRTGASKAQFLSAAKPSPPLWFSALHLLESTPGWLACAGANGRQSECRSVLSSTWVFGNGISSQLRTGARGGQFPE